MGRINLFIIASIFFTGCISSCDNSEDSLEGLSRQRIANSKYVIYEFSYAGYFTTNSDYQGLTILDSNIPFSKSKIDVLPCSYFTGKPAIGNLKMLQINYGFTPRTEKDTLLTPLKHYAKKYNGVGFDITEYNTTYGSSPSTGLMEYDFESIKETEDSVTFYNVHKWQGSRDLPSTVSFVKGNIRIVDSISGNINYIEITEALIQRGDIYKPRSQELVHDQPVVGYVTYWFHPLRSLSPKTLTDYGIYKRVR